MAENNKPMDGANWIVRAAAVFACFGSVFTLVIVPWRQPHPTDPALTIDLGYAAPWTTRFADLPHASINLVATTVNFLMVWGVFVAIVAVFYAWKTYRN